MHFPRSCFSGSIGDASFPAAADCTVENGVDVAVSVAADFVGIFVVAHPVRILSFLPFLFHGLQSILSVVPSALPLPLCCR